MRELIENALSLSVAEDCREGDWGLTDKRSCADCSTHSNYFYISCDDKIVLKLHSGAPVRAIRLEEVFQTSPELSAGGCCDYLLYDGDKVALCELTCSRPEHVGGKRARAYAQLSDSIDKLGKIGGVGEKVGKLEVKDAVFAARRKVFALESTEDEVQRAMRPFFSMTASATRTDMGNGFSFLTVDYPQVYEWK